MADNTLKQIQDAKLKLQGYKQTAENTKLERARNEATLDQLKKNEAEIIQKIQGLGYDPDNLKDHIEAKLTQITAISAKLDAVMPGEDGVIPQGALQLLSATPAVAAPVVELEPVQPANATDGLDLLDGQDIDLGDLDF